MVVTPFNSVEQEQRAIPRRLHLIFLQVGLRHILAAEVVFHGLPDVPGDAIDHAGAETGDDKAASAERLMPVHIVLLALEDAALLHSVGGGEFRLEHDRPAALDGAFIVRLCLLFVVGDELAIAEIFRGVHRLRRLFDDRMPVLVNTSVGFTGNLISLQWISCSSVFLRLRTSAD